MGKKEDILEYCIKRNEKLTAMDIIEALYPGKTQPYINNIINELVYEKKLVRIDTRPYTIHVPAPKEIIGPVTNYARGANKNSSANKEKCTRTDIEKPCAEQVEKYLAKWNELENYRLQESALDKLFFHTYPSNTEIEEVLVKVATLNDFYSTQIFSVYPVAKHIVNLSIDERLRSGDANLVNDISSVKMKNGTNKNFYSFATKYCSHHQPEKYAIYDDYVVKVLKYFRNVDGFSEFSDSELKDYKEFNGVLHDFQEFYGLQKYNLKLLDRYLWLLGKEKFPKDYSKKRPYK